MKMGMGINIFSKKKRASAQSALLLQADGSLLLETGSILILESGSGSGIKVTDLTILDTIADGDLTIISSAASSKKVTGKTLTKLFNVAA